MLCPALAEYLQSQVILFLHGKIPLRVNKAGLAGVNVRSKIPTLSS